MLRRLLGAIWRRSPRRLRRLGVRLSQPTFTVTAGAVVLDARGRVLLLKHTFRAGSGWGIPGGFLNKGEQPEAAVRRELREEVGLEVSDLELAFVRTIRNINQIEIIFRCRSLDEARPDSLEIGRAEWFPPRELPRELNADQRRLIERALAER